MDVLRGITWREVIRRTEGSEMDFFHWLQEIGVLPSSRQCPAPGCGSVMAERFPRHGRTYGTWRCTKKNCPKEVGALTGTFFDKSKLSLQETFHLSYLWARGGHTHESMRHELRRPDGSTLSEHTIIDWCNFFRDVCARHFESCSIKIGGPGVIVEIDETVLSRRKYNRGRQVEEQWYFGGVERGSGRCFISPVKRRDAHTLLEVLCEHVLPGTIIISDGWAAYGGISELPHGYSHYVVNHSENYVDPISGAHTNSIEVTWQKFKHRHKREYGTARSLFASYVTEFLWRKRFDLNDLCYHLWEEIAKWQPIQ